MPRVSFIAKSGPNKGKRITFTTKKRKGKRKPTAYNRFVAKCIRNRKKGTKVTTAMRAAAKAWKKKSKGK